MLNTYSDTERRDRQTYRQIERKADKQTYRVRETDHRQIVTKTDIHIVAQWLQPWSQDLITALGLGSTPAVANQPQTQAHIYTHKSVSMDV